jgi:hypothetical protein
MQELSDVHPGIRARRHPAKHDFVVHLLTTKRS